MKKVLVLFVLLAGCIAGAYADLPRIAIMSLENKSAYRGGDKGLGDGMADMMVTSFAQTKKFRVIERAEMERILKEQAFTLSGAVNPQTAAKVGQLLGVEYMIIGSVNEFGTTSSALGAFGVGMMNHKAIVGLDIRAIDCNTAEISAAATGQGSKSKKGVSIANSQIIPTKIVAGSAEFSSSLIGKASRDAVDDAVKKMAEELGGTSQISIIKVENNVVFINVGKNAGIKKGEKFQIIRKGEEMIDPDTGESLGSETQEVGEIEVSEVLEKFSKANIIKGSDIVKTDKIQKK